MAGSLAEKLDFVMKLTGTRNTELGRALSYDASYISRIRGGRRGMPREPGFLPRAAAFLAGRVREPYQKRGMAEALGRPWPETPETAAALLADWLRTASWPEARTAAAVKEPPAAPEAGERAEVGLFFGAAGKQTAVMTLLKSLEDTEPGTMLLYSDEDFSWLYEDPDYTRAWASRMRALMARGWRFRIIHTVNRSLTEMWEAVRSWLPLYLTGAIDPWYYPRLQDGVMRRSLILAPGRGAIVSRSVRGQQGEPLNALLRDRAALGALEREYAAMLALCRPLMEALRPAALSELAPLLADFRAAPGEAQAAFPEGTFLCAKEGFGALIVKTEAPCIAFRISEARMVAAIGEYLQSLPVHDAAAALARMEAMM